LTKPAPGHYARRRPHDIQFVYFRIRPPHTSVLKTPINNNAARRDRVTCGIG
jgi:hypothetical protein